MQLTRLLCTLSAAALDSVTAEAGAAERKGEPSEETGYLRKCDIGLFPELRLVQPPVQGLTSIGGPAAGQRSQEATTSRSSPGTAGDSTGVSRFQKKRKRMGNSISNTSSADVGSSSPCTPIRGSPGEGLPRSPSLSSVRTADDEYDCFSTPPSVHSEAEESPMRPACPDVSRIGPADRFTGVLRLLQNMSHRCAPACLHMCSVGGLDACVTCLDDWFRLRQRLSAVPSIHLDAQVSRRKTCRIVHRSKCGLTV